jgi:hypothetical protein
MAGGFSRRTRCERTVYEPCCDSTAGKQPLGEFWIQNDLVEVEDALKLAARSAANDADQQALQELQKQSTRLRTWSDWLIDQNRHLSPDRVLHLFLDSGQRRAVSE